ncbi:hypothetical protein BKA80DRAFT_134303 [Phyllosticta citrichinensis]
MPAAPPPPPPPPMPGFGGGPPPPPPPGNLPARPPAQAAKGRGALLGDIEKGARLRKVTQVNDRSAPQIGKVVDGPAKPTMGAPPVPGMAKPPGGLAPPVPGNRARSSSDTGRDRSDSSGGAAAGGAPQLAGIFAGVGMPKLRKTGGGGVDTGASTDSPYLSDPETMRARGVPKSPPGSAPKPPSAPRPPGGAPPPPPNPAVAALKGNLRPTSTHSLSDLPVSKPKPPPPIGKKPPMPPPSSRKPSNIGAPAPPTPSASATPSAPPPPPPSSAPAPPSRATPPPPPGPPPPPTNGHIPSLAEQAARNAFGRGTSPAAPPPPPPSAPPASISPPKAPSPPVAPPPPPVHAPTMPLAPPPPPSASPSRSPTTAAPPPPRASTMDPSAYTLTNGGGSSSGTKSGGSGTVNVGMLRIHDGRWKFQDDGQLPKPREYVGGPKKYRAGRGSSVPLDLSQFD